MITPAPTVADHDNFERQLLELRKREKAHTRESSARFEMVPERFSDDF